MNAHLRYRNPDGTTKDWLIEEIPGGFRTRWGRTGQVNQEKTFEKRRFPAGIYGEMRKRIQAQLRQGYTYVGGIPPGCPQGEVWESPTNASQRPEPEPTPPLAASVPDGRNREEPKPAKSPEAPVWDLSRSEYPLFV